MRYKQIALWQESLPSSPLSSTSHQRRRRGHHEDQLSSQHVIPHPNHIDDLRAHPSHPPHPAQPPHPSLMLRLHPSLMLHLHPSLMLRLHPSLMLRLHPSLFLHLSRLSRPIADDSLLYRIQYHRVLSRFIDDPSHTYWYFYFTQSYVTLSTSSTLQLLNAFWRLCTSYFQVLPYLIHINT